ncbi:MAG: hypothetical protein HYZ58_16555 [Acidobacteria bacterium]|nr:hypothetical protein [Acidobacteriota bacterium]
MTDPVRTDLKDTPEPLSAAERETRVEELLLTGLDRYFSGHYEEAAHIWTRVLFLDRGHARARAYIDRARSAQAEQLRELDEMLHAGLAAFNRGDKEQARRQLTAVVQRGGTNELAQACLDRLDRLEAGGILTADSPLRPGTREAGVIVKRPAPATKRSRVAGLFLLAALLVAVAALGFTYWDHVQRYVWFDIPWLRVGTERVVAAPDAGESVPLVRPAELILARARQLYSDGHLRDALRALDAIPRTDTLWPQAERLRAEIQQVLLKGPPPLPPSA